MRILELIEMVLGMVNNRIKYDRDVSELRKVACMFWPPELADREAEISIIPRLLQTQDEFLSILGVPVSQPEKILDVIENSSMPANLFLKHLIILSDFGGEMFKRINTRFFVLFPDNKLEFTFEGSLHTYKFKSLPIKGALSNDKLGVSGDTLVDKMKLDDLRKDVIFLLLHGSTCSNEQASNVFEKCVVGSLIGKKAELEKFVKQRYILVSKITSGAKSNTLGQIAQDYVKEYLENNLGIPGVVVIRNGTVPRITHSEEGSGKLTNFDIVVHNSKKYVAVEVSFQVTTNSVIERKAGQARARYEQIQKAGHKIAYVLDGVGNFERASALGTICSFSHCTVAFSDQEFSLLCKFIKEHLES